MYLYSIFSNSRKQKKAEFIVFKITFLCYTFYIYIGRNLLEGLFLFPRDTSCGYGPGPTKGIVRIKKGLHAKVNMEGPPEEKLSHYNNDNVTKAYIYFSFLPFFILLRWIRYFCYFFSFIP